MSSLVSNPTCFNIQRDGNNQEYIETCNGWVRATLVTFEGSPHIRIQEHHEAGGGRLHLGPLIPLDQWLAFKGAVDTLVGPSLRDPQVMKRTLSSKLEYAILKYIAALGQRRVQNSIGGFFTCVRGDVPELVDHNDLLFALKRLHKRGRLRLITLDGIDYQGNPDYDTFMFFRGEFIAEITPEGWSYWESIKD
jgi:hypothetical protein